MESMPTNELDPAPLTGTFPSMRGFFDKGSSEAEGWRASILILTGPSLRREVLDVGGGSWRPLDEVFVAAGAVVDDEAAGVVDGGGFTVGLSFSLSSSSLPYSRPNIASRVTYCNAFKLNSGHSFPSEHSIASWGSTCQCNATKCRYYSRQSTGSLLHTCST